ADPPGDDRDVEELVEVDLRVAVPPEGVGDEGDGHAGSSHLSHEVHHRLVEVHVAGQAGEQAPRLDASPCLDEGRREGVLEALVVEPAHLVLGERPPRTLVGREDLQRGLGVEAGISTQGTEGSVDRDREHSPEVDEQGRHRAAGGICRGHRSRPSLEIRMTTGILELRFIFKRERGAMVDSALPRADDHRSALATALAVLFGLTGMGSAAVAVALPVIARDLELTAGRAALVVSCYSLALAVGSAIFGRLGDVLGIRAPLVIGLAVMVTAACAGALAGSLPALLAARTLQGLGAAAVPALTLAAVQAIFSGEGRAR